MLNFVPMFQPLVPAATAAAQAVAQATMNTTLELWTTFDTWTETVKLDRIDIIIAMLSFLLVMGIFQDHEQMSVRREAVAAAVTAAKEEAQRQQLPLWVGVSESNTPPSPALVPSPPPEMTVKSAAPAPLRACVDPPDELTQALLTTLSKEYSLTAQQLREALPAAWSAVEKSEVNTRLYKMLGKNMVLRWQLGSEPPMWSLPM